MKLEVNKGVIADSYIAITSTHLICSQFHSYILFNISHFGVMLQSRLWSDCDPEINEVLMQSQEIM